MKFFNTIVKPAFRILSPSYRKKSVVIIFLMILQAFLDFLNITAFFPLLALISKPDAFTTLSWLQPYIANYSHSELILLLTAAILIFTTLKSLIVWKITVTNSNFVYDVAHDISLRVIASQLRSGYLQYIQSDFSKEMSRASNLPLAFANNIIISLTTLVSEGIVSMLIVIGIAFVNFKLVLSLLFILIPLGLIYMLNRKKIKKISDEIKVKYPESIKYAMQTTEAWSEIKTNQKETYFFNRFKNVSHKLAKVFSSDHTTQVFSSRLIELFTTLITCSIIFWSVISQQEYQNTLLLLAIYVGASFRLLPSINRILNALLQIKGHEFLLDELKSAEAPQGFVGNSNNVTKMYFEESILLDNISFSYPGREPLFNGFQLKIKKGEKVALIGKSGDGKTSLLLILLGILRASSGKVVVDNKELADNTNPQYGSLFSYVSQQPYILDASIKENVAFGIQADEIDLNRLYEALHQAELFTLVDGLPERIETQIGEKGIRLSGGQRQRLAIARALYTNREILVLDEVTNQLDKETEAEIIKTLQKIAQQNKTILMVTHHRELLPLFDRVLKLENGKLADVTVELRR